MKTAREVIVFVIAGFVLLSCNQIRDQWVLQSYDKDKGYVFVRNGVQYEAKCVAVGQPILGHDGPNATPDLSPDALPPELASGEDSCGDILVYLHKPVPNLRQVYGSVLLLIEEHNQRLEFEIKRAK
jgi:hypothetical protein